MYLGILRFNARKPLPLLGVTQKCASEVSNSGEEKVFSTESHGTQRAFRGIVIDLDATVGYIAVRIPRKLDSDSTANWTRIPRQTGQSERSDAGLKGFTLNIPYGSSFRITEGDADGFFCG